MTIEEKVAAIRKAIEEGVPKKRIDRRGHGSAADRLAKGGGNLPAKIDEMYENLQAFRNNGNGKTLSSEEDLDRKEKVAAIKRAIEEGVPKRKIDRRGHGSAADRLAKGGSNLPSKIDEMYENLQVFRNNGNGKSLSSGKESLEHKVKEQEQEIAELKKRLASLENALGKEDGGRSPKKAQQVLGIPITQKTDVVGGRKYVRWYGYTNHNGKRRWIYIGKDQGLAEVKIKAWLEKKQDVRP